MDTYFEIDIFGLAGTPWMPHGAAQPYVISKGPHFYAGDNRQCVSFAYWAS